VAEENQRACEVLRRVFEAYLADPDKLGEGAMRRIEKEGLHRSVCDYIAGMTDRYVMEEYARLAGRGGSPEPPSRTWSRNETGH
jgi:dGTPase